MKWPVRILSGVIAIFMLGCFFSAWAQTNSPESPQLLKRYASRVFVPSGNYLVDVYANGSEVVLHFQSADIEKIIDAESGMEWNGDSSQLLRNFRRLGAIKPNLASVRDAPAALKQHLQFSGCFQQNFFCTTLEDASLVVFASHNNDKTIFTIEVHDYTGAFENVRRVFAGDARFAKEVLNIEELKAALVWAGQYGHHDRWIDAIRADKNEMQLARFLEQVQAGSAIYQLAFVGADISVIQGTEGVTFTRSFRKINLKREAEVSACSFSAKAATREFLLGQKVMWGDLLGGCGSAYSVFVSDAMRESAGSETPRLAQHLRKESAAYEAVVREDIQNHACWLDKSVCQKKAIANAGGTSLTGKMTRHPPEIASQGNARAIKDPSGKSPTKPVNVPTSNVQIQSTEPATASSGAEELRLVREEKNSFRLVGFKETGVGMKTIGGDLGGLVFTLRPADGARSGVFWMEIFPNEHSPVKFTNGSYRVRSRLQLDFLVENKCNTALSCAFGFATDDLRSQTRFEDAVFELNHKNGYRFGQRVRFGALAPSPGERYTSVLKNVNLAVLRADIKPD